MIHITNQITNPLIQEATKSDRKRKNFNFHQHFSDRIHRMIHATNPETYVQPHKHENPDKMESFIILKGRVLIIEFSEKGEIIDHLILDPIIGNYGAEIPAKTWHTLLTLEPDSLVYEIKDGPWDASDDKNFATWAPSEGEAGCAEYNNSLLRKLKFL
ncbi:MAG: WbuC family cupin fold metalloprotein [Bacteroidetes bacterium]|nr:WbuC family cupin fold metalloprotein [Bacteroidota bacterium]